MRSTADRAVPLLAAFALIALFAGPLTGARAAATSGGRTVTASAICDHGGAQPEVRVTIVNHTGAPLQVAYVHGFTTPQATAILARMVDPGTVHTTSVPNDASRTVRAPWDRVRQGAGYHGGALVVTSAGLLLPGCSNDSGTSATLHLGSAPSSASRARRESVSVAAETIGRLEAERAYPALYALLHPAVRAKVPFRAVACWYATQYGLPESPTYPAPFSVKVRHVRFGDWTWGVTGQSYHAAEVTYRQEVGSVGRTQSVGGVEHLVLADGLWRWFFGADPAVAGQPTDCDLGETADQPAPGEGSITYVNHRCPAGTTRDDFDPSACSPDPLAIDWHLSGPSLDRPLTRDDATTTGGPEYTWDHLRYGDYVVSPVASPADAGDVIVRGDQQVTRQSNRYAIVLGSDQPHVRFDAYVLPSSDPAAQRGSIEIDFFDCPPGTTVAILDPADCSPSSSGSHGYVLVPGPGSDLEDLPGGPIFGLTDEYALGNARYRIDDLPFGTYEVGPSNNDSGPILYAPGFAQHVDETHPVAGTYTVTINANNPNAVIAFYRVEGDG